MNEVMLFEPTMQQSYLQNEFVRKFHPIATIQFKSPIKFLVKNSKKLYLDSWQTPVLFTTSNSKEGRNTDARYKCAYYGHRKFAYSIAV